MGTAALRRSGRTVLAIVFCVFLVTSPVAGIGLSSPGDAGQQSALTASSGGNPVASEFIDVDPSDLNGSGTASDPYNISNVSELQAMQDDLSANYTLVSDIDASNTSQWNGGKGFDPVGDDQSNAFTGSFDGNGYSITDITINYSSNNSVGIFGFNKGTIEDVSVSGTVRGDFYVGSMIGFNARTGSVSNVSVRVSVKGTNSVGGLVGTNQGVVRDVSAKGSVNASASQIGGLVGVNGGTIINSTTSTIVNGSSSVGGLVGNNNNKIVNVSATGQVNGTNKLVGGLVGTNSGTIRNATAFSSVNGLRGTTRSAGTDSIGGLVGANSGTIERALAYGTVTGSDRVGGLAGENTGTIRIASAYGSVNGSRYRVGGLVGLHNRGVITNTSARGSVTGAERIGGLVGESRAHINHSFAVGLVNGSGLTGGVVGSIAGEFDSALYSYWDTETTNQSSTAGHRDKKTLREADGLRTKAMIGEAAETNMSRLAFGTVWVTQPNDYPILAWRAGKPSDGASSGGDTKEETAFVNVTANELPGDGTAQNPFEISNASELQAIEDNLSAHYELVDKINASVTSYWNNGKGFDPIGSLEKPFTGVFNGSGHRITNLYINRSNGIVGLFSYIKTGTVGNVTLDNVTVTGTKYVGTVAGYSTGTVTTVSAEGTVTGTGSTGYVGGLIGLNSKGGVIRASHADVNVQSAGAFTGGLVGANFDGKINRSDATGAVTGTTEVGGLAGGNSGSILHSYATGPVSGEENVGGLVGDNGGLIDDSYATGDVSGITQVGGLVGYNDETIRNSHATGAVSGDEEVGGLIGVNADTALVSRAYATGTVTQTNSDRGLGGENTGGLVGENRGTIRQSWASATVESEGANAGGLVGYNYGGKIVRSYATGKVAGTTRTGGLVGYNDGSAIITRSYAAGNVSGTEPVGGLVGNNSAFINDSYWDEDRTGQSDGVGANAGTMRNITGLTTAQMTGAAADGNMSRFGFGKLWVTSDGYPLLAWRAGEGGTGDGGGTTAPTEESDIAPFTETQPLTSKSKVDTSLSGMIRVETPYQKNKTTYVEVRKSSPINYSIAISAPDSANNVTFYLQTTAISASQNIENLTMYLDSENHPFNVTSTGPGNSPWVAFNVPHFSTRTVTFTTDGDRLVVDADGGEGNYTDIQPAVDNATDGDIVEVRPGTYKERGVTVDKDIVVVAPDGAVLNGSAFDSPVAFYLDAPVTVAGFTIREYGLAISATSGSSDWVLRDSILRNNSVAIRAPSSKGNWTVRNTTIRSSVIGVHASNTTGNWSILNSTIAGSEPSDAYTPSGAYEGTAIYAGSTTGSWEVHGSIIVNNSRHGINATNADPAGNATYNWWGNETGPTDEQVVGNVTVEPALSSSPDETATISGTLTAESGASLESDQVALFADTGGNVLEIVTTAEIASDGSYEITGLKDRSYQLGYLDRGPTVDNGVPDLYALGAVSPPASPVNATLPKAYNRSIRVTDQSGDPIQNADVYVRHNNTSGGYIEILGEDATNSSGYVVGEDPSQSKFEFVGNLTFGARYHRIDDRNSTTISEPRDQPITLSLALSQVSGRIKLPNETNASGDIVVVNGVDAAPDFHTTTNDTGNFSVSVPTGPEYEVVYAQRSGFDAPVDGVPDIYPINRAKVTADTSLGVVDLPAAKRLNVTVRNGSGTPIPNASIHVEYIANGANLEWTNETDSQGRLVVGDTVGFEGASGARVQLYVEPPKGTEYTDAYREVTLDENRSVNVTLLQQVPIEGNVTTETGESANGLVVGQPDDERARFNAVPTDPDGNFTLPLATNASYELGFRQVNETTKTYFPRDGVPDVAAFRRLETGTTGQQIGQQDLGVGHPLNITVQTPDGDPVDGAHVTVQSVAPDPEKDLSIGIDGQTNGNGSFVPEPASMPGIEVNGTVRVHVEMPSGSGYVGVTRIYDITSDTTKTIEVVPAMTVNGTILQSDDETPTSVDRIELEPVEAQEEQFNGETVWTNESGYFNASVAENGTYHVGFAQVDSAGEDEATFPKDGVPDVYALANVSSPSEAALGTRTLPPADNLTIHVVGPDGEDVSGARVHVGSIANDARHYASDTTNSEGNLTVEVNGSVQIYVEPDTNSLTSNGTDPLNITNDTTITVQLDKAVPVTGVVEYYEGADAEGYRVTLHDGNDFRTLTNETGYFELYPEPNTTYAFGFKQTDGGDGAPDFPKDGRPDLHLFEDIKTGSNGVDLGTKELPPAHLVNVTVETYSGETIDGAEVFVSYRRGDSYLWHPATTNATGEVVLRGASAPGIEVNGTLEIDIDDTDRYYGNDTTIQVDSSRDVTVLVRERVNLTGMVTANGSGLVNSTVVAAPIDEGRFALNRTDEDGNFSLDVGTNRTYSVRVLERNATTGEPAPVDGITDLYEARVVEVKETDKSLDPISVPNATGNLSIRVVNTTGAGIENATVRVVPNQQGGATAGGVPGKTGRDGYVANDRNGFEATGNYTLRVEPPEGTDYIVTDATKQVNVTEDTQVKFTLQKLVTITGEITANGSEMANSLVYANAAGGDWISNRTNDTGHFRLRVEPDQTYSISVAQINETGVRFPGDNITDLYEATVVDVGTNDVSLGELAVPNATGNLTLKVESDGEGVENAKLMIAPNQAGGPKIYPEPVSTEKDGYPPKLPNNTNGLDVSGNYTIRAQPPETGEYVNETYVKQNVSIIGEKTISFELKETAQFNLSVVDPAPSQVTTGSTVSVEVRVNNTGDVEGSTTVDLVADETVVDQKDVTSLGSGANTTVTLSTTFEKAGTYELSVLNETDSISAGTVTVVKPANVTLTNATVSPKVITAGETIQINATVRNTGGVEGNISLVFYREGSKFANLTVRNVSPGATKVVSINDIPIDTSGKYNFSVANRSEGGREIQTDPVIVEDKETETGTGAPGFGFAPAIVALLGAAFVLYRRR